MRTNHFRSLGGFDPLFSPFYWEDADLGWRGWQNGLKSMALKSFEVLHDHSPSIGANFKAKYVRMIAVRNLFYFNWRSLWGFGPWTLHLMFLPFHLIRAITLFDAAFLEGFKQALTKSGRLGVGQKRATSFWNLYQKAGGL